ncbi:ATPase domain-containing protein [Methanospirillum sp.]|uniref:PRK06067 family protein n=1 Tax=Methanospirillum sp. TaxID=45200 RepID=UPI001BD21EA1|nr:ATPase domain-containing protein [Methanospirillum sp.]
MAELDLSGGEDARGDIADLLGKEERKILTTGNAEIDKKIADGLPLGSLTLIEGENDTGKSVLTQQFMWGSMHNNLRVDLFSTELTTKSFLTQMESMSLDISDFFAWGYIRLFHCHLVEFKWTPDAMNDILERIITHVKFSNTDVAIIDSLTIFTEYTTTESVLTFLTQAKNICDQGKTILITMHTYAFTDEVLTRVRSICDAHLLLMRKLMGDKYVMVLEVVKVRGARKTTGNLVSFEVHPGYGMKIIPVSVAKV